MEWNFKMPEKGVPMKEECPHCKKELKLVGKAKKTTPVKEVFTSKYKCPVSGCGYSYTETVEEGSEE
jgi:C4-type Zn-finger protein